VFLIPAVIISACYVIIVVTIWSKGKDMTLVPSSVGAVTTGLLAAASNGAITPEAQVGTSQTTCYPNHYTEITLVGSFCAA
jgi:hypothetical protein